MSDTGADLHMDGSLCDAAIYGLVCQRTHRTPASAVGRVEDEGLRGRHVSTRCPNMSRHIFGDLGNCDVTPCPDCYSIESIWRKVSWEKPSETPLSAAPAPVGDEEAARAARKRLTALVREVLDEDWRVTAHYPESVAMTIVAHLWPHLSAALSVPGERDNVRPTTGAGEPRHGDLAWSPEEQRRDPDGLARWYEQRWEAA